MKPMSQKNRIQKKVLQVQKKIFYSLQTEIDFLLGKQPESISKYAKENNKDFILSKAKSPTLITKDALLRRINEADVTFIGDYHTFDQAQRTALRMIREVITPASHWVIGLEMIPSQYQQELDDFQAGKLTVIEFHESIQYSQEWGFSWKNYEPIFHWAKENRIRLIALNQPKILSAHSQQSSDLKERDRWAAGIITDLFRFENGLKMMVLYGELHVGTSHLPKQLQLISEQFLERPLQSVTIHQNHDQLYWKIAQSVPHQKPAILELNEHVFCVFSSTPWAKLQSLMSWAEGGTPPHLSLSALSSSSQLSFDEEFHSEEDDLYLFSQFVKSLSEFFEIPVPSLEAVSIHRADQTHFLLQLTQDKTFHRDEIRVIRSLVKHHQKVYIPKLGVAYLGTGSINSMIELAAVHILREHQRLDYFFKPEDHDFFRLLLESTFGFLGSLILNPNRKCDLPIDHIRRLESYRTGEKVPFLDEPRARELTLELLPQVLHSQKISNFSLNHIMQKRHDSLTSLYLSTRYLGQILAKKLHIAILDNQLKISKLKALFLPKLKSYDLHLYKDHYLSLMNEIQDIRIEISKNESL